MIRFIPEIISSFQYARTIFCRSILVRHDPGIVAEDVDSTRKLLLDGVSSLPHGGEVHQITIDGSKLGFGKLIFDGLECCL